jgi:hypothetical protein
MYTYRRALFDYSLLCDTAVSTRTSLSIDLNKGNSKLEVTETNRHRLLQGTATALGL